MVTLSQDVQVRSRSLYFREIQKSFIGRNNYSCKLMLKE